MDTNQAVADAASMGFPASFLPLGSASLQACRILIIDDEPANVRLLERVLARAGFAELRSTTSSREAAALFAEFQPDLVLTDWLMPGLDGCAVIGQLRALMGAEEFLPIIVLTADITPPAKMRALLAGATDFLTKPFDQSEILLRIHNLLQARLSHLALQASNTTLEEAVRQRTLELERMLAELRRTQQQVIQQERLAALGSMAGGIAHDFNNALSIIMGFGELLLRDAEHGLSKEHAAGPLAAILTAAEDAAQIVHRLRDFHRPGGAEEQRLPVDLNQLIEQAIALTRPRWQTAATAGGRAIAVRAEPGEIPRVSGDAAELREVLTNLIFNAVDALPAGGAITLGTRGESGSVVLQIHDTGAGMNDEVRQRCLEPFFTTKGARGTGLGLAMVFGIVQRHGGTIAIDSAPGRGTTFALRLPAVPCASAARPAAPVTAPHALRILCVDDLPILCHVVCQHLEDDLHTVETALGGAEALEKFRAAPFDVVITDHVMAGMTGTQLATAVKALAPGTPVILLTGYAGETSEEKPPAEAIDLVLAKPVSHAALRQALGKVMARV